MQQCPTEAASISSQTSSNSPPQPYSTRSKAVPRSLNTLVRRATCLATLVSFFSSLAHYIGCSHPISTHIVASPTLDYGAQHPLKVSLLPNPSHLGTSPSLYICGWAINDRIMINRGSQPRCTRQNPRQAVRTAQDFPGGV